MLKKQDKEPTPENLFIAMCAKLTANSMNTCDQDLIPAKTKNVNYAIRFVQLSVDWIFTCMTYTFNYILIYLVIAYTALIA